jgi:hypothetical protein
MKHLILVLATLSVISCLAQLAPPQAFSYSAVARNGLGNPLINQNVGIQFSILKGSTVGPIQYQENQFTTTNQFGLFNLTIGTGAIQQGTFSTINWGNDSYYLKVGLDAIGGTNFQTMGTTQFLSVPYALYAGNTSNQSYQILSLSNDTLRLTNGGSVYLGNYRDSIVHQTLSFNNDTLKISQGNQIVLPYNTTPNLTVKINDVDITDPSINDVRIGPYTFLTETGYRYDFNATDDNLNNQYGILSDSLYLITTSQQLGGGGSYIFFTGSSCNGSLYVPVSMISSGLPISRGRIFSYQGSVFYVPLTAATIQLTDPYVASPGNCTLVNGTYNFYQALPNNPAVTGFGFALPRLKVTFSR